MVDSPVSRKHPVWASAGALALLVAYAPAPRHALAVGEPEITQRPQISGTAQVGQTLTSTPGAWDGRLPPITATYQWLRCNESPPKTCSSIAGATGLSYAPVAEDIGHTLRMVLTVTNSFGEDSERSDPTNAVTPTPEPALSPTPGPAPSPSPTPGPAPSPSPTPVPPPAGDGGPRPDLGRPRGLHGAAAPQSLPRGPDPRPPGGPRSTGHAAHGPCPPGARVAVSCSGAGCPTRRWAHTAALTRVGAFEASLPAGVHLTVKVTRAGRIGKHTLIVIRRGRQPLPRDRCLYPGSARPRPWPA